MSPALASPGIPSRVADAAAFVLRVGEPGGGSLEHTRGSRVQACSSGSSGRSLLENRAVIAKLLGNLRLSLARVCIVGPKIGDMVGFSLLHGLSLRTL